MHTLDEHRTDILFEHTRRLRANLRGKKATASSQHATDLRAWRPETLGYT